MRPARISLGRAWTPTPDDRDPGPRIGPGALAVPGLVLGLLLLAAGMSSQVTWEVGLVGLGILAALAVRRLLREAAQSGPLHAPAAPGPTHPGPIEAFSRAVRRASRGLPFSQVIVASRARAAFLERVRLAHGLSPEDVREPTTDAEDLRLLVRDEVLGGFLHLRRGDLEEQYEWVLRARARRGFSVEFREVLDRMEAWR